MEVKNLGHASVKIVTNNLEKIYVDPYDIGDETDKATYIFISHNHYDHYSFKDIEKILDDNTVLVVPQNTIDNLLEDLKDAKLDKIYENQILEVSPDNKYSIEKQSNDKSLNFETVKAYNLDKDFHKKQDNNVGYILEVEGQRIYIAGDTDDYGQSFDVDYAIVPIGGTYTMDAVQASKLVNRLKPKKVSGYHFGKIVGTKEDEKLFKSLVDPGIKYVEI